ncbi:OLC1v1037993C1 [Oldenlandia corymbosa var. corymbosa]|uniref:OLC1v1037993C1 n=1 Tax=Oldenlandia corymbosa var. corymbosa TaxID=529605 RepID=A0AAV1D102_OLDCO|nr:OLC1v1037993C1 [Oldenlandia corymbosa var. corymbosa]
MMRTKISVLAFLVALVLATSLYTIEAQKVHVVGGSLGWIVPPGGPIAYSTWASLQTFSTGDILEFNFNTGEQDLARVTKEAFDACNATSPLSLQTTGPANYTLSSPGDYYFISTFDRHCFLGQKLAINVPQGSSSSAGPSSSPQPPPPAGTPSTSRTPLTYVVGDDLGWIVPPGGPIAYRTWAYDKTFFTGDILLFNFTTGQQDVARVTKEAFDACNSANPISLQTNGPASYTLSSPGEYYFISTLERHCFLGQKLVINVTQSSPSSSSPASPRPSPTPVTSRAPITYVVGDKLGWIVPPGGPIAYRTWAYDKIFAVGDTLVFNFENGTQDVVEVTKSAYGSCDTSNPIRIITTSPARITLTSAGEHFFTSTYSRHCFLGQKLNINVTDLGTGTGSPSIAEPPSDGSFSPVEGPDVAPAPFSSATRHPAALGFFVSLLAIAFASLSVF